MKTTMKKALSVLLSVLMVLSLFGTLAFAATADPKTEDAESTAAAAVGAEAAAPHVCEYCGEVHNVNKPNGFVTDMLHDLFYIIETVLEAPVADLEELEAVENEAREKANEPAGGEVCEYCGETHNVKTLKGFITDAFHDLFYIIKSVATGFAHLYDGVLAPAAEETTAA